jgi:hypothetical protein
MRLLSLLFTVVVSVVAFAQVPTITSFSPTSGSKGTSVTITGTGFNSTASNNTVYVDGVKASVVSSTSTSIVITIPGGTSSAAEISIVANGNSCNSVKKFNVTWNSGTWSSFGSSDFTRTTFSDGSTASQVFNCPFNLITSGDFDLDGDLDVAHVKEGGANVNISQNTSSLSTVSFNASFTSLTTSNSSNSATVADLNNDGKLDLVVGNGSLVDVFLNTNTSVGTISFSTKFSFTISNNSKLIEVLDINKDGKLDILSGSGADVTYILNTTSAGATTPTFGSQNVITWTGNSVDFLAKGNFNNDGFTDILVVQQNSKYALLTGTASGLNSSFSTSQSITMQGGSTTPSRLTVADFNADGNTDFAVWQSGTTYGHYTNNGSGTFTSGTASYPSNSGVGVGPRAMDLNGDGKAELVHSDYNSSYNYSIMKNSTTTSTTFDAGQLVGANHPPTNWNYGDFNGDGKVDIITGSFYDNFVVCMNNIGPVPVAAPAFTTQPSISPSSICLGTSFTTNTVAASNTPTSYEWEVSTNSGTTWTPIASSNVTALTATPSAAGTYQYRCKATNSGGTGISNVVTLTVNANPTLTTNPTTTLSQYCYANPNTSNSIVVATSASSPTYQWQVSNDNATFANVTGTNGSGDGTGTYLPSHVNVWYGGTKYYRCIVTSNGCSTTSNSKPYGVYAGLTAVTNLSTSAQTYCSNSTATTLTMVYSGDNNLTYQWYWSPDNVTWPGTTISGATSTSYTPPTNVVGVRYYRCRVVGTCSNTAQLSGAITVTDTYTWTGATSTDPTVAGNWNPASVPCSGANEVIPSGLTNYPSYTNLTIDAGTTFTVQSGAKMDISGILTNNGTLTIESGATLVQGASSTLAGSGTYNVKQNITGAGSTTPSGRFWYLGSPVSLSSSSVYFGNAANVVKKRDEAINAWITVASGTPENLVVGKGYYTQAMANSTINFTGGVVNNGAITINGLTRTSGQSFEGFNLVSNPYPSYLNWDAVTRTNVDGTMWYRTNDGSNMVFDTYVANAAGGIGTNLGGTSVTKFIPPMQSFWVRVSQGQTSGSLTLGNAMRSHFSSLGGSTAGLKSTNDEPSLFLRMNLLQAGKKDQLIVYVNETATNGFDALDGEKMMQSGFPQFYTKAGDKKIVINGLNSAKKQQALPITMELPTTGVHSFIIEDLEISNGLVWLEDKQEEIIQALEPGTVYNFYAASGMSSERFVLHFQLIDDAVPTNVYNEVNSSANFSGKGANVHAEAAGVVVIKLPASTEGVTDIQIKDATGKVVYTGSTNNLETSVQLAQANGIYYVTLNSTSGVEVRKVFIQQ